MEKRKKKEIIKDMAVRRMAFERAFDLVTPIVVEHGLEEYPVNSNIFFNGSRMTKVDQNVSSILEVAEWLLEPLT